MQQAMLVGRQVILIFLYAGIGIVMAKTGIFDVKAGKSLANFGLGVVMPCLLIRGFIRPMNPEEAKGISLVFLLAVLFHVLATLTVMLVIRKRPGSDYRDERLGVIFSNCGYMAIPLIRAACGETGAFYVLGYISVFNLCLWSMGVIVLTGERKLQLRRVFLNPGTISFFAGVLIYAAQIPVPAILVEALDGVAVFNTPLSMITVGVFLAAVKPRETFTNGWIYLVSLLRLMALPLAMLAVLKLLGISGWMPYGRDVALAVGLGCACPCAAAVTLLPAKFGRGGEYGAQMIAVTTLFSVLTLPLITYIINTWL